MRGIDKNFQNPWDGRGPRRARRHHDNPWAGRGDSRPFDPADARSHGHGHGGRDSAPDEARGPRGAGRGRAGGRSGGRGFGPGGFGPGAVPGFGPGGRGGFPGGQGPRGRRRAGRGDVRAAILLILAEQPMHGYQLIQEIGNRSGGAWRPSPGAVYPALSLLEDEGLVELSAEEGRRLAHLTDAGRTYVTEHSDELTPPWADVDAAAGKRHRELREAVGTLVEAVGQVARTGDDAQVAAAVELLARTRREVYLVLAGETPAAPAARSSAADGAPAPVADDAPEA